MVGNNYRSGKLGLVFLALICVTAFAACSDDSPVEPPVEGVGTVSLVWDAPFTNADGTGPLIDLVGYKLCYGSTPDNFDNCLDVGKVTRSDLTLDFGTYFVAVRAIDTWGNESDFSNVLRVIIAAPELTVVEASGGETADPESGAPVARAESSSGRSVADTER